MYAQDNPRISSYSITILNASPYPITSVIFLPLVNS
jgi:hypothetical protein